MMKQLKYFFNIAVAVALTACSNEDAPQVPPTEKEPLLVTASVDGSLPTATTRASGADFALGDKIVARLQHVYGETPTVVDEFTKQVTFTVGTETAGSYLLTASTGLFWDDFSNSSSTDKDIRTDGHGVRSYYAYCMNGRSDVSLSDEATGTLTWTVQTDQSVEGNLQKSDLLWSKTQEKAVYKHTSGERGKIELPFKHAMSKVTIVVKANEGFGDNPFVGATAADNAQVTLQNMNSSAVVTLPAQALTGSTPNTVVMYPSESGKTCTFEAIVAPGTVLTQDEVFAIIDKVEGNKYEVKISEAMLTNWSSRLESSNTMKSGVNYKLEVTINKQKIDAVASLANWTDVTSTGAKGEIQFTGDITTPEQTNTIDAGSFDLYWGTSAESLTSSIGWSYSGGKWTNSTPIYWENGTQAYYFRALAKYKSNTEIEAANMTTPYTVEQGDNSKDILWATTPAHTWNGSAIAEGDPVHPRTGAVPLSFSHALSKVTVKLKTSDDDDNKKVNLTNATVTISPIATTGTLNLKDGTIELPTGEASGQLTGTVGEDKSISSLTIPQAISGNVKLQVELSDHTTYSLQLNTCKNSSGISITQWERGVHYTYEVTLNKEEISFVAFLKEWVNETGSGDATLDW